LLIVNGSFFLQVFSLGKNELQKYSGVKISANSFPRISSRSYLDDFDDTDFSCPFDVDYDEMKNLGSRYL
jgi:autophagy-related protein 13